MNNTINHTSPVELAIDMFGGVRKLARALNRDPAAVSRWQKTGIVPTSVQRRLLELAWERGIDITAHDIVFGREVND
jgi:hypothetical protein